MKNSAIYLRVSTTEQAETGFSIDEQKERLLSYCNAMDWNVSGVYIDGGYSGADMNRPGLQNLIKDIKKYNNVVIYKLDRLSRRQKDTLYLIEDIFIKNNVDIVSLQENLDTSTPFGRAAIGILAAFAQLERETFKERSLLGRTGRARSGKWIGTSRPPIGYDYNPETQKLTINEYEAEQVQKVFDLYLKGTGLQKIAAIMKEQGYTHRYGNWSWWGGIFAMLKNPVYIGKVVFNGQEFDGEHQPIIDIEVFNTVQELLEQRKNEQAYKRTSPFSHLLECGNCGAKMFYRKKPNREPKYYCYSRFGKPEHKVKDRNCKMKYWNVTDIDARILNAVSKITSPKFVIYTPKEKINSGSKKRIEEIDRQIAKLIDLYKYDHIPADILNEQIRELQEEKNKLSALPEQPKKQAKDIKATAKSIISQWDSLTMEDKISRINMLISKVIVQPENIEIVWTFDMLVNE